MTASPKQTTYVATAYRWGARNEHNYLVAAGPSKDEIISAARDACEHRGGKYGVQVLVYRPAHAGRVDPDEVAYFASMGGEPTLSDNEFKELQAVLGGQVLRVIEGGAGAWGLNNKALPAGILDWLKSLAKPCVNGSLCEPEELGTRLIAALSDAKDFAPLQIQDKASEKASGQVAQARVPQPTNLSEGTTPSDGSANAAEFDIATETPGTTPAVLPFTEDEQAKLQEFTAMMAANPGVSFTVPPAVQDALARVMAPVNAQTLQALQELRRQEWAA